MGSVTGRDDAGVTQLGNSGVGRDWCIAGMRARGGEVSPCTWR